MKLEVEKYLHHLDGLDISNSEKTEFIRTLWLIAQCFVDDAYRVKAECDKCDISQLKSGFDAANVIELDAYRQTGAEAANDNSMPCAKKEPKSRGRRA